MTGDRTETAKDASGGVKASEREEKKEGDGRWLGGGSGEGRNQCELLVMRSQMAMRPHLGRLDIRVKFLFSNLGNKD